MAEKILVVGFGPITMSDDDLREILATQYDAADCRVRAAKIRANRLSWDEETFILPAIRAAADTHGHGPKAWALSFFDATPGESAT